MGRSLSWELLKPSVPSVVIVCLTAWGLKNARKAMPKKKYIPKMPSYEGKKRRGRRSEARDPSISDSTAATAAAALAPRAPFWQVARHLEGTTRRLKSLQSGLPNSEDFGALQVRTLYGVGKSLAVQFLQLYAVPMSRLRPLEEDIELVFNFFIHDLCFSCTSLSFTAPQKKPTMVNNRAPASTAQLRG